MALPAKPARRVTRRWFNFAAPFTALCATFPVANVAKGGAWPERTVRILTPTGTGGSVDIAARLLAERLADRWGQPVIVDNRPGADGILGVQALVQATDGHTLLFAFPSVVTVVPLLHDNLPYDPEGDLLPISSFAYDSQAVAVNAKLAAGSLDELLALARARPGQLNWTAPAGSPYLTFLEFQRRGEIAMTHVPYRSVALALPDLVTGEIQAAITPPAAALSLAQDGKIRLLAVTTLERVAVIPTVPTASEAGHPELTIEAPLGLFGPKTMPSELRERIAADVQAVAGRAEIGQRLRSLGMSARASSPNEYAAKLAEQRTRWTALARAHGMRPRQ
jgi:tripartite-type tricarboxylate transporter receptor subunit TctC